MLGPIIWDRHPTRYIGLFNVKGTIYGNRPKVKGTLGFQPPVIPFFSLCFQHAAQKFHIFGNLAVNRAQLFDFLHTVNDRGVIAPPETAANFR